jgi:MoaA/NifB/PqqE/SkfB family radical SAM enzyme
MLKDLFKDYRYADAKKVEYLQVDHTTFCNLLCPQCGRVYNGKFDSVLPRKELSLDDYKKIINRDNFPNLKRVFFCGNFGDAIASDTFLPALKYLKTLGLERIDLVTSGSMRDADWWREVAKVLNGKKDLVVFSIDGLEDTNHIYRVNSNWKTIMRNVTAFIETGGRARWDMLVFKHNEHQVEDVRKLAKEMGFIRFSVKRTNRFVEIKDFEELKEKVEKPKEEKNKGSVVKELEKVKETYKDWNEYVDKTSINCKFKAHGDGLFLDFEGKLWPCTWLAGIGYKPLDKRTEQMHKNLVTEYGEYFNCLKSKSLKEVLNNKWFKKELVKSWRDFDHIDKKKSSVCAMNCGEISYTSSSEKNRSFEEL